VHLTSWITVSQPPLVATLNWCEEKCVGIMVLKLEMHELYCLNYRENVYELEDPIGEKTQGSNLPPKLGLTKKNSCCKFSQSPIRKCLS